ncbi:MAG: MBL fold metallo-hydrolase [Cyclobacteriaceae bacterium]
MKRTISLQFLGCGDAFGSGGQSQTCFYLRTSSLGIMVDCGATSLVRMQAAGLSTDDVDIIALTHFHGDHYGGIPYLLLDAALIRNRQKPLTIISPPGGESRITRLLELMYPGTEEKVLKALDIIYIEYNAEDRVQAEGGIELQTFPVFHSPESLPHGFRLRADDRTIGFSGDTYWCDALPDIASQADLFICECNFFDTDLPQHLNYVLLEKKMGLLKHKQIILNHLGEEMHRNSDRVSLPVAKDGQEIVL